MYKIGVIGYGTIGQAVVQACVDGCLPAVQIIAVLVRDATKYRTNIPANIICTDNPDVFFSQEMHLVIEAAGQDAVRAYALQSLSLGVDVLVSSIGAFTDDGLFDAAKLAAVNTNARLYLISGALPGVDWLSAASMAEVEYVCITQSKPVHSWLGTHAELLIDLSGLKSATSFFTGSARQAASMFQKSSNITAMLALATVGMDRTQVTLVADPNLATMQTRIQFAGELGSLDVTWRGVPSQTNPSTSADVPYSVIKAIRNITGTIVYGV